MKATITFQGRSFWDRSNLDAWLYYLFYLIEDDGKYPNWIADWITDSRELLDKHESAYNFGLLTVLENKDGIIQERVDQLVDYSMRLLNRLENFNEFLASERKKWLENTEDSNFVLIGSMPDYHMEMLESFSSLENFRTFGQLFIKLLTGEGWTEAYSGTMSQTDYVWMIDYLNAIKPDGEVLHIGSIEETIHWISSENKKYETELTQSKRIPDLVIIMNAGIVENSRKMAAREQWELDRKLKTTRVISTIGEPSHHRYSSSEDFYSEALRKTVNLEFLYQIGKD